MIKSKETKKEDFVRWFFELNKESVLIAGGKGANLSEIYNLGIPVPPGFVVTSNAYEYFIKNSGISEKINELLGEINYEDSNDIDEKTKKIREMILDSDFPSDLEEEILDAYNSLDVKTENVERGSALDILKTSAEPPFVAVRSSATTEDFAEASFAGQQESYLNVKGNENLINNVKKCFASLFTPRATYYRFKKGFDSKKSLLAVVVQIMVDSFKSGVIFSKDPSYNNDNIILEAVWGLGEGIVSGKITPDYYVLSNELDLLEKKINDKKIAIVRNSGGNQGVVELSEEKSKRQVLTDYEIKRLGGLAIKLEEHFQNPQDIEFAIEGEDVFIVQTRPITTIAERKEKELNEIKGQIILSGMAASPGIGSGKVRIINSAYEIKKITEGDILVTKMTNPEMVIGMQKASGIITDEGGLTAHAAIVSREMRIPCVVGTKEATQRLQEGELITVDGYNGKIYKGRVAESEKKQIHPVVSDTKTQIKLIVDLPIFAERASKTNLRQVGLTCIEGIIAESGKHPNYYLENKKLNEYQEVIFQGLKKITDYFDEIWVRTSDIRSDEYFELEGPPREKEPNPILGMHGIRYGLKYPEILKAEIMALKRVADSGKRTGILFPQVVNVDELKKAKSFLKELNFINCEVGVMIETPAAVQLIKDFCDEGIDFISFGTNDLTQYMLAVDRGNPEVQYIYNEMHPVILYQLSYVIRVCKREGVKTSICGQAVNNKEMIKFLVEKGIDSISVNADVASEIAEYIESIEKELIKGTDREPRHYELKKRKEESEKISEEESSENFKKDLIDNDKNNPKESNLDIF